MKYQDWQHMSKKKSKFIPELRFPEFKNEGEWEYVSGDDLFEPISNKGHNSDLPILAITQEQGAVPREMINYHVSVTEKSIESYKVVEVGDFIISLRSFQGGIEYSNYLGLCSPAYIVLRKKEDVINDFYRHYFKSYPFIQDLNKNLEGIRDGKMISYKQFSEILIPKPRIKEQEEIAYCLTSFDEVILAYGEKLELLKGHKKGLLQNLFPQDGEKLPKLRFKEFKGEWISTKLENVCAVNPASNNLPQQFIYIDLESVEGGILKQKKLTHFNEAPSRAQRLLEKEDVLFQMVRPYQQNNYLFIPNDDFDYVASTGYAQLRAYEPATFLYQYLHNPNFLGKVLAKCTGSNYPVINSSDLAEIPVLFPSKIQEQQKIASCLSALDEIIKSHAEVIEQLKLHKKGLMQSLFPKALD